MCSERSPAIYLPSDDNGRLHQGEILVGLVQFVPDTETGRASAGEVPLRGVTHEYAIVMSQDCDLEQDFSEGPGSQLPDLLMCQVVTAQQLRAAHGINSTLWRQVKQNSHHRYQVMEAVPPEVDLQNQGVSALGIDFRRHFTLPTTDVYRQLEQNAQRRAKLVTPYREHLAGRFAFYIARVGLPRDHDVDQAVSDR